MATSKTKLIAQLLTQAHEFKFCGPSDDIEAQTAVTIGYRMLIIQLKRLAGPLLPPDARRQLESLEIEVNNILSVYDAHAELESIVPDIEAALEEAEGNFSFLEEDPLKEISMKIFISHTSRDIWCVRPLVALIQKAFRLGAADIRCTSLDGYRLSGGSNTDAQLRKEIGECDLLLGVLSAQSVESTYVVFELGARWGNEKAMIPVLVPGASTDILSGPLTAINALSLGSVAQVHQVIAEISNLIKTPSESASSIHANILELSEATPPLPTNESDMTMSTTIPRSQISDDAMHLLITAVDAGGTIMRIGTMGGTIIQAGRQQVAKMGDRRDEARWAAAVDELEENGLTEDRAGKGEVFFMTHGGYKLADEFRKKS